MSSISFGQVLMGPSCCWELRQQTGCETCCNGLLFSTIAHLPSTTCPTGTPTISPSQKGLYLTKCVSLSPSGGLLDLGFALGPPHMLHGWRLGLLLQRFSWIWGCLHGQQTAAGLLDSTPVKDGAHKVFRCFNACDYDHAIPYNIGTASQGDSPRKSKVSDWVEMVLA